MSNTNLQNLPPEMQARLAQIMANAQNQPPAPESPHQAAIAQPQQQVAPKTEAPIAKPPSLMDHTIALRQEVAVLNQQVAAMGQVVDAVGQAVGQLYAMFQQQTTPTNYSTTFQAQQPNVEDSDY